jgi:hypothetical protein
LFAGAGSGTAAGCGRLSLDSAAVEPSVVCCNSSFFPLVVVSDARALRVDGLDCHGDESRACCNLAASGERVMAEGTLEEEEHGPPGWVLRSPKLCALSE